MFLDTLLCIWIAEHFTRKWQVKSVGFFFFLFKVAVYLIDPDFV